MSTDKTRNIQLDHVFIWTEPDGGELARCLEDIGLVETYRRKHPGQGTCNICYCFENAFLELLWVEDKEALISEPIKRCQFLQRSMAQKNHANPFGIAWRGNLDGIEVWDYRPPYLPRDLAIQVAKDSDNLDHPFMFTFAGFGAPSDLPPERKGNLQANAGFKELRLQALVLGRDAAPSDCLNALEGVGIVPAIDMGHHHSMILRLTRGNDDDRDDIILELPLEGG